MDNTAASMEEADPSNFFDLLIGSLKDPQKRSEMAGLLRALGRRFLGAIDNRRAEDIYPFESVLQFLSRALRSEVESTTNLGKNPNYLLGRVDSLVDLCGSAVDRSISESVLSVAKRRRVSQILGLLKRDGHMRPAELSRAVGIAANHLSNTLRFMGSADLVRRIRDGRWTLVSLGPQGEAAYDVLMQLEEKATGLDSIEKSYAESMVTPSNTKDPKERELLILLRRTGQLLPEQSIGQYQTVSSLGQPAEDLIIFPKTSKYVELAHGKTPLIWDPEARVFHEFLGFPGGPPSFPQARALGRWIADVVREKRWHFDTICTMSTMALTMAYSFMSVTAKDCRVVACDNITCRFLPESFLTDEQGRSVVLMDTIVQSGGHLQRAWEALSARHTVVGFVAAFENDMLPAGGKRLPFLSERLADGSAVSLKKASAILRYRGSLAVTAPPARARQMTVQQNRLR